MSSKQKKLIIKIIIGIVILAGIVISFLLIQSGRTDEALELKAERYREEWGYTERVTEIEGILRLQEHKARELLDNILTIVESDSMGPITAGVGMGALQTEIQGLPINITTRAGTLFDIKVEKAIIHRENRDNTMAQAEREYTLTEYLREIGQIEKALKVERYDAHKSYQSLIQANIFNIKDIKRVKREPTKYTAKNGEMEIELNVEGARVIAAYAIIPELDIRVEIFGPEKEGGSLRAITPMGGGRATVQGGLEYKVSQRLGIPRESVIMPVALPDAGDTWVIIDNEGQRYIKVRADIDTGKGMDQREMLVIQERETTEIEYLKMGRKEY